MHMRLISLISCLLLSCINANAQFGVYTPIEDQSASSYYYPPSSGYGVPFGVYEPIYDSSLQQRVRPKPKMREYTTTGYYKNGNRWYSTPIRVGIVEDQVRLQSFKYSGSWSYVGNIANQVSIYDSEEIRDNFNYKAYSQIFGGMIYF